MTEIYKSSTGDKVIADMNPHNLMAAHAKLLRDFPARDDLDGKSLRQDEIDAMGARLAAMAEEEAEQAVSQ